MSWRKEGLADLMRQGFMKPRKKSEPKDAPPIVACEDCLNWHREGMHTEPAAIRKARRKERSR